jgi:molecular chaperone GrpE
MEVDRTQLVGALRELEAAKARVERDARSVADEAKKKLVSELLPVLDNLDRTIKAAEDSGDAPSVVEGIALVRAQLEGVLRGYGVERIDAIAVPFDPALHDAITTLAVLTPDAHNLVIDQIAPGYRFGGTLLRPAQVVVGKYQPQPRHQPVEPVQEQIHPWAPAHSRHLRPLPPLRHRVWR